MSRRPLVPPHIAWPAAIVGLLLTSVGVSAAVVVASRSDGGAEVVDRPYTDGSDLDTLAAARRASRALGWTLAARAADADASESRTRTVALTVADGSGAGVSGLRGTATVSRPQRAGALATLPVVPTADGYRVVVPFAGAGLYDLAVDLRHADGTRLLDAARLTLR